MKQFRRAVRAIQEALQKTKAALSYNGFYSYRVWEPKQDSFEVHGSPLKPEEVVETRKFFGWPLDQDFYVPEEALNHMREIIRKVKKRRKNGITSFLPMLEVSRIGTGVDHAYKRLPPRWDEGLPVLILLQETLPLARQEAKFSTPWQIKFLLSSVARRI